MSYLPRHFANSSNHREFEKTRRSNLRVERSPCGDIYICQPNPVFSSKKKRQRTRQYLWYSMPS